MMKEIRKFSIYRMKLEEKMKKQMNWEKTLKEQRKKMMNY